MAKISIKNGVFMYNGIGISHGPDDELDLDNVHFEGNKIAAIMKQQHLRRDQLLPFLEALEKHQGQINAPALERAAEKSGLTAYFTEHGWEIGSFILSVSQEIGQHPDWLTAALGWARGWS